MLKVDKKGNILRPNGTILGVPNKKGNIYRGATKTGSINTETGEVFNLKEESLGKVLLSSFEIFITTTKEDKPKVKAAKIKKTKVSKSSKKSKMEEKKPTEDPIDKPKAKAKEEIYKPGLDSALLVSGKFAQMYYGGSGYKTVEDRTLEEVNKKYKWTYKSWDELSEVEDLSDEFLTKYEEYVDWCTFLTKHPDREFDEKHAKQFKSHLILRTLHLVPYNGTIKAPSEYKQSSIKEDRARAEHIKELKAKREARKKMKEGKES